jgi:TetR/AcrR family transcriptional repressor of nem operon
MRESDNRQRIIAAANQLFSTHGYANTSIADIAEHAGLLKGNLSYYFKTKADILKSATHAQQEKYIGQITQALNKDSTALESIEEFLAMVEDSANELSQVGCPVGSLSTELGKHHPELQPFAGDILSNVLGWLTAQFCQIFSPKVAQNHAEHLLSLMQGAAVVAHAMHDKCIIQRRVKHARIWLKSITTKKS